MALGVDAECDSEGEVLRRYTSTNCSGHCRDGAAGQSMPVVAPCDPRRHGYGYEKEAAIIQDLYLDGKKREAEAAVPEEFLELTTLCGPASYVAERVAAYREAGVTHLQVELISGTGLSAASLIEMVKGMI
jgi:hypothetical protein